MIPSVLFLPLLLSTPAGAPPPALAPPLVVVLSRGDVDGLLDAYDEALEDWKGRYRSAEGMKERRALKAAHPALEYAPRFEALADTGEGRALLWMIATVRDRGFKVKEGRAEKSRLFGVLIEKHVEAEWFGEVLEELPGEQRSLVPGQEEAAYRTAIEKSPHRTVQAHAMYELSQRLYRNAGERAQAESEALMQKLADDYADTPHGEQAEDVLFVRHHLSVGKVAPDFEAQTIDGHDFKLTDYRGKVVLVDFYGFW